MLNIWEKKVRKNRARNLQWVWHPVLKYWRKCRKFSSPVVPKCLILLTHRFSFLNFWSASFVDVNLHRIFCISTNHWTSENYESVLSSKFTNKSPIVTLSSSNVCKIVWSFQIWYRFSFLSFWSASFVDFNLHWIFDLKIMNLFCPLSSRIKVQFWRLAAPTCVKLCEVFKFGIDSAFWTFGQLHLWIRVEFGSDLVVKFLENGINGKSNKSIKDTVRNLSRLELKCWDEVAKFEQNLGKNVARIWKMLNIWEKKVRKTGQEICNECDIQS